MNCAPSVPTDACFSNWLINDSPSITDCSVRLDSMQTNWRGEGRMDWTFEIEALLKKCIENKELEEGKEVEGRKGALSFLGGRLLHVACRIMSFLIIHSSTEHDIDNRRVILTIAGSRPNYRRGVLAAIKWFRLRFPWFGIFAWNVTSY